MNKKTAVLLNTLTINIVGCLIMCLTPGSVHYHWDDFITQTSKGVIAVEGAIK